MAGNPGPPTFEPSFKAAAINEEAGMVEVVGGLERVWLPVTEFQRSLVGQLLLQDLRHMWMRRIWTLIQIYALQMDQQDSMFISGDGPGGAGLMYGPVYNIKMGKYTISAPKSVLKATWAGSVLLKNWQNESGHLCT